MAAMLMFLAAAAASLFAPHGEKAVVLVFIRSDCPISNRYAPTLERLYKVYAPPGMDWRLVYVEPSLTAAAMESHRREYGYTIPAVLADRVLTVSEP